MQLSCSIVAAEKVPAKTSLPARPTAPPVFHATSFKCPKWPIEHGPKVGLYHVDFLRADRHHVWQVIDDMRGRGVVVLYRKPDLLYVPRSFLPALAHQPRELCGGAASAKVFARIGASPYPVGRTAREPHGDISQLRAQSARIRRTITFVGRYEMTAAAKSVRPHCGASPRVNAVRKAEAWGQGECFSLLK